MPKNNFAIVTYPRTGSTYLIKVLNSCPACLCHSEIFHNSREAFERSFLSGGPPSVPSLFGRTSSPSRVFRFRNRHPVRFLRLVYSQSELITGFKIFPRQNQAVLDHVIRDRSVRKIFLRRENLLRNYLSYRIAKHTGVWDRFRGEQPRLRSLRIDVRDFMDYERRHRGILNPYRTTLENTGQHYLDISYEAMLSDLPSEEIGEFLGVDLSRVCTRVDQEKQNPFDLEQMIVNYREVLDGLSDHGLTAYID